MENKKKRRDIIEEKLGKRASVKIFGAMLAFSRVVDLDNIGQEIDMISVAILTSLTNHKKGPQFGVHRNMMSWIDRRNVRMEAGDEDGMLWNL